MTKDTSLREKALRATPGGWLLGPYGCVWPASDVEFVDGVWREKVAEQKIIHSGLDHDDAAYIAAADPQTILALLDASEAKDRRIEALEAENAGLNQLIRSYFPALSGKEGQS